MQQHATDFRRFLHFPKIAIDSSLFFIHYSCEAPQGVLARSSFSLIFYIFFIQFSCEAAQGVLARLDTAHAAAVLELRL